ncbi:MAG TPA: choice-of-anchor L domain-containing protein, partial [Chitinophagaceae bacterium]|nr:choice-of-anchor L domain-containing protein [Chitinophagaceae bacterium]
MRPFLLFISFMSLVLLASKQSFGQLQITSNNTAAALAQKLVGEGVTISNATITNNPIATGFFKNLGNTNIGMDSGIVLTNGRAKSIGTSPAATGVDNTTIGVASGRLASNNLGLPGDQDLATELQLSLNQLNDAIALEFDFVPLGDSIKFNYVLSSEEYDPQYVCNYNDAFAFFISGPGITGIKNIALVPGTNTPVTITNVNNVTQASCINNPQYYIDNTSNVYFTHDGHTTILTATAAVQPCQRYHLKLVVADFGVGDHVWDTGVFLEAGSLRSEPIKFDAHTPLNELNLPYLAEGCVSGNINVVRNQKRPYPQTFNLFYGGTATNGVDVSLLPSTITIPANDSVATLAINAIADFISEPYETLKIYVGNSCATLYSDSLSIEIRDIDMLAITPPDSAVICRHNSIQLDAVTGYLSYSWSNGATLSSNNINNPVATPVAALTNYICTATIGNCIARDSIRIKWRTLSLANKTDVPCKNGTTGSISIAGTNWETPVYGILNGSWQSSNTFTGLAAGTYWVKTKDASGCTDSIEVTLVQSFPDISITANSTPATCSITPDGNISVQATGGSGNFSYSNNGATYQGTNSFTVANGTYNVYVQDNNGCRDSLLSVIVPKINTVVVDAEPDTYICEGTSFRINATTNAASVSWFPTTGLTNAATLTPTANPVNSTLYYITATLGTCTRTDSIMLNVWPAPVAQAGDNIDICYGISAQLNGSGGVEYQWSGDRSFISSTNINNPVVKPSVTSNYYLQVKDIHGCSSLQTDAVTVKVTPSVKIFAGNDTIVAMNQPLQLHAIETNNSGVTQWEWSAVAYLNNPLIASPIATFPSP